MDLRQVRKPQDSDFSLDPRLFFFPQGYRLQTDHVETVYAGQVLDIVLGMRIAPARLQQNISLIRAFYRKYEVCTPCRFLPYRGENWGEVADIDENVRRNEQVVLRATTIQILYDVGIVQF